MILGGCWSAESEEGQWPLEGAEGHFAESGGDVGVADGAEWTTSSGTGGNPTWDSGKYTARTASSRHGFDRFWRNVRTHTLREPVGDRLREVGDYFLNGAHPPFTLPS
ncbi:hypothetical protein GCM10023080_020620 [Streptomyces pseudoechinosporeus]